MGECQVDGARAIADAASAAAAAARFPFIVTLGAAAFFGIGLRPPSA